MDTNTVHFSPSLVCQSCGAQIELNVGDGSTDRQEFLAIERHIDKAHLGAVFTWRGLVRS